MKSNEYHNHKILIFFRENLLAFFLFFAGIFHLIFSIKFGANSFGDLLDGRLNNFFLEHFYLAFTGQEESFTNANFSIPFPM